MLSVGTTGGLGMPATTHTRPGSIGSPQATGRRCGEMATVETVRGAINTADLGRTYMREDVFVLSPDVQQNYPSEWGGKDDRVADAVGKLKHSLPKGFAASPTQRSWAWVDTYPAFNASPSKYLG
jgi:hypothetical protein